MTQALAHDFASVLTGDLVASRRHGAEALDEAMQVLDRASRDIGEDLDTKPVFQRHRGDGWQLVLPMGQYGLRAALRIQAALAAAGSLATRLDTERLQRWFAYLVFAVATFVVIDTIWLR